MQNLTITKLIKSPPKGDYSTLSGYKSPYLKRNLKLNVETISSENSNERGKLIHTSIKTFN